MKVFVDENIPSITVRELRENGHDVMDIRGSKSQGISDEDLWDIIKKEQRLLITTDKGFAQKRFQNHSGIIIVKLKKPNRLKIHKKVMKAFNRFKEGEWSHVTVVVQDTFSSVWKTKT